MLGDIGRLWVFLFGLIWWVPWCCVSVLYCSVVCFVSLCSVLVGNFLLGGLCEFGNVVVVLRFCWFGVW